MKVRDLLKLTYKALWSGTRNEVTAMSNARDVARLLGVHTEVSELTQKHVTHMRVRLKNRGLSVATLNRKMAALSSMLRVAREHGEEVPDLVLRTEREPEGTRRILTEEELATMLRAIDPRYQDLVAFLADTGCRVSEALNLGWEDVDLKLGQVTFVLTKSGRRRTLPLTEEAAEAVGRRGPGPRGCDGDGPFDHLDYKDFYDAWVSARNAANLDRDIVPHCLRHTMITRLIRAGVPMPVVQKWAGHSKLETTMRYSHLEQADLVAALGRIR